MGDNDEKEAYEEMCRANADYIDAKEAYENVCRRNQARKTALVKLELVVHSLTLEERVVATWVVRELIDNYTK